MNWQKFKNILWFVVMGVMLLYAIVQAYNLGYRSAQNYYEGRLLEMERKRQQEMIQEMKKRFEEKGQDN